MVSCIFFLRFGLHVSEMTLHETNKNQFIERHRNCNTMPVHAVQWIELGALNMKV